MLIFPMLHTPRLTLRKLEVEDLSSLVKYANNKTIADNIINIPHPYREPDAAFRMSYVVQGFKQKTRFVFAIIWKESGELIGEISLHLLDKNTPHGQLAYWIGEPFWNRGITTEAVEAVLDFGFKKLNLDLIYADCYAHNIASQKVLLNNKMQEHKRNGNLVMFRILNLNP